jgi:hypothetical protein
LASHVDPVTRKAILELLPENQVSEDNRVPLWGRRIADWLNESDRVAVFAVLGHPHANPVGVAVTQTHLIVVSQVELPVQCHDILRDGYDATG